MEYANSTYGQNQQLMQNYDQQNFNQNINNQNLSYQNSLGTNTSNISNNQNIQANDLAQNYGQIQGQNFTQENPNSISQNLNNNSVINLTSINTTHLTNEDQSKLVNITNLQNSILAGKAPVKLNNELMKDGRGEKNLKRDLSDREKAELELKKWNKEQKKVNKNFPCFFYINFI